MEKTEKLNVRDFITIGIMSAIFAVVYVGIGMFTGSTPIGWLFTNAILALPLGIVYMLLLAKVPKKGAALILGIVFCLVMILMGHWWPSTLLVAVFALIAEIVSTIIGKKRFSGMLAAFVIYMIGFPVAGFAPLVWFKDAYISAYPPETAAYYEGLAGLLGGGMFWLILLATAIGAVIGAFLGKSVLKKHFVKAGIVN